MSTLVDALLGQAGATALSGPWGSLSRESLARATDELAGTLARERVRVLATLQDNGPAWVVTDLAAMRAGVVHVPLAGFQSPAQCQHILNASGADTVLCPVPYADWSAETIPIAGDEFTLSRRKVDARVGADVAKISFTSGSTGTPKGIRLREHEMHAVARSIAQAFEPMSIERHQGLLPLAVLLENVAGIYAPLLAGASIDIRPCASLGLRGATGFAPEQLQQVLETNGAQSLILLPQMLRAWTGWLHRQRRRAPAALRFVAVGGAAVGAANLQAARALGLPAFEGYGLTEGASVQTLNLPGADRPGSAGRPLPHCRMRCREDGELEIAGAIAMGAMGEPAADPDAWLPTGDLGTIDEQGFVWIDGRKKNLFITGYGRNVSPEWIESMLESLPTIARAIVFGEGLIAPVAVIWTADPALPDEAIEDAIAEVNEMLPDYARVGAWERARHPFDEGSGMATANGRPRRDAIAAAHRRLAGTGRAAS